MQESGTSVTIRDPAGIKRLKPVTRKRRRTQSDCGVIFDKDATEKILSRDLATLTLLEKAHVFRTKYPKKFHARQLEIKTRDDEMIGIFQTSPIIQRHYKRIQQIREEAAKDEKERKKKPRIISVEIKFKEESGSNAEVKRKSVSFESKQAKPGNQFLTFCNPRQSSTGCELIANIVSGDCLYNGLDGTAEKWEKSWVSAMLLPNAGTKLSVAQLKSENSKMNRLGQVRWETTFVFRGYTAEEMANKYIKFVVMGKTRSDKICVGQAILSGRNASIDIEDCYPRKPRLEETCHLADAFKHPGKTVATNLRLYPPGASGLRADDVSYNSAEEDDVTDKQDDGSKNLNFKERNFKRTTIRRKVDEAENANDLSCEKLS